MSSTDLQWVMDSSECLFNEQQIAAALDVMAAEITARLAESNPLLLCVMNGGIVVTGHLAPRLKFPLQIDYIHATRYREQLTGSELHWRVTPATALAGRVVLVVDDIFDEGETLAAIRRWCLEQGAAAFYSAVLVDKQHDRKCAELRCADFSALDVPDRYVFGYGMDYKGYWRNAPGIFAVGS
jgi:hypoxanthine phosphoribosyltransferase